ncbi:hypothetical protein BN2476_160026 [Paraburkholderia piptadeniae]|uniref:Uncharacterized protein n=1 Tax=Paraburkholderia piptadeniae TaxID=1701573 RepID=A0A1N7RSJ4_9BURK|nr:hypothetical protein BN2476_160026 [Paraburkholderia piptadeniae]
MITGSSSRDHEQTKFETCIGATAARRTAAAQCSLQNGFKPPEVHVLERPAATTLIVAWSEASRCCYGEQVGTLTKTVRLRRLLGTALCSCEKPAIVYLCRGKHHRVQP